MDFHQSVKKRIINSDVSRCSKIINTNSLRNHIRKKIRSHQFGHSSSIQHAIGRQPEKRGKKRNPIYFSVLKSPPDTHYSSPFEIGYSRFLSIVLRVIHNRTKERYLHFIIDREDRVSHKESAGDKTRIIRSIGKREFDTFQNTRKTTFVYDIRRNLKSACDQFLSTDRAK